MSVAGGRAGEAFLGVAQLMRSIRDGENLAHLIDMAAFNPSDADRLMGLSVIFQLTGSRETGLEMQARALQIKQHYRIPGEKAGLRLLALLKPGDMMDNTAVDFLLGDSGIALDLLYVAPELPVPAALPEHDVLLVAIGQSDENRALLARVEEIIRASSRPVLNPPEKIQRLSRSEVSRLLEGAEGMVIPATARVGRSDLQRLVHGQTRLAEYLHDAEYPVIVRPLDLHAGIGLARINEAAEFAAYLEARQEEEFYLARYADYRSADGLYRKYRIALIGGRPYACHMAISEHWIVHYKNAGMEQSIEKRAEEADFMNRFDEDFALRHEAAFRAIGQRLEMDYLVLDCAETQAGELLVFEVDNIAFVHDLDPADIFPYKRPQMRKVFNAFCAMLSRVTARG